MKSGLNDYVLKSHLARLPLAATEALERQSIQAEHRELQAQLRQVQKLESLGLLVSGIAHDFNNMLAGIMGYAARGLAHTPPPEPPFDEYFQHIHARAEQGARMTRQLLAFARGTALEPRHVLVNEQIDSLVDFLQTLMGVDIQVTFRPDPAVCAIYADPTQLEQVLVNLCLNARDAMSGGGSLEISTRQVEITDGQQHVAPYLLPGTYVLVRIQDTGVGMDKQTLARLFEPFFTTKEIGKCTGLGLAVVYGVIKQHHGVIRVESQVGQGSTFSLYFPATEPPAESTDEPPAPAPMPTVIRDGSELILVVEDDLDIRAVLVDVLQEYGYTVLVAADGEEGARLFDQHADSIALVIADIMMPKMQGKGFQEQVRGKRTDMRMLVMSGYQEMELKHRDLLDPRSAVLQKPFDLDVFLATVRQLLGKTDA
jgi:signal transduction histidine kinase/ActR/RegA family two-component response regulator